MYRKYFKRLFDIVFSLLGIVVLSPIMLIITLLIFMDSGTPIIYKQLRVTLHKKEFWIYKFRTMRVGADREGTLTIGNDKRVTKIGKFLRRTKLDEIPQLINIFLGDMSFVGPRPDAVEDLKYYKKDWDDIFQVRAGITDYASIYFYNLEIQLNKKSPHKDYIERILPQKIELRREYIKKLSFFEDLKIIVKTLFLVSLKQ